MTQTEEAINTEVSQERTVVTEQPQRQKHSRITFLFSLLRAIPIHRSDSGRNPGSSRAPYINRHSVVPPVDELPLTIRSDGKGKGYYGAPRSGRRRHRGIDLLAPLDSPVRAVRSGVVTEASFHRGLGNYVVIQHDTFKTLYAHLSQLSVESGSRVRQGQMIGAIGKTGNAKHPVILPHVHFEVFRDEKRVDPLSLGFEGLSPSASSPES